MSYDLRLERLIDATPEETFAAFTDPDAMLEWYQDGTDWSVEVRACDVRVGGTTIVAFGPGGDRYVEEMTYREVQRPHRLAYIENFLKPDGTSHQTELLVTFDEQAGKTLMTIVQTGFPDEAERDGHQGGWPGFIDRLERTIARRRAA